MTDRSSIGIHFCLFAWLVSPCGFAVAETVSFSVFMDGQCAGTGSSATGNGIFTLETTTGVVSYTLSVSEVLLEHIHIHGPADDCIIAHFAPTQVWLPTEFEITDAYTLTMEQQDQMLQERHWINVHTQPFSSGEIRGRITRTCPNDCSGNGVCQVGQCVCDSLWLGTDCAEAVNIPTLNEWNVLLMSLLLMTCATMILRREAPKANAQPDTSRR